uniref:Uncharacterized protein n=1 Tax=Vitrella brassicaformis TaxID=1169539 RepID=A0A7S1KA93_9ALVE
MVRLSASFPSPVVGQEAVRSLCGLTQQRRLRHSTMAVEHLALRVVFATNVVAGGSTGLTCLWAPKFAANQLFSGSMVPNLALSILGIFITSIAILSACGIYSPLPFASILLISVLVKVLFLVFFALPWLVRGRKGGMGGFPVPFTALNVLGVVILTPFIP